jgi:AraC family ethanolamine operon transcriptional activator
MASRFGRGRTFANAWNVWHETHIVTSTSGGRLSVHREADMRSGEASAGNGVAMRGAFHLATRQIESVYDLRECLRGADIEVVQLAAGRQRGSLTYLGVNDLEMTLGRFALQVRARGVINPARVTLGMVLATPGRVMMWGRNIKPGDVVVIPAGIDLDAVFNTGAAYAAISLPVPYLAGQFTSEPTLADPDFWTTRGIWSTEPSVGTEVARRLAGIFPSLERNITTTSPQAADFLTRTIVEAFVTGLLTALPPDRSEPARNSIRLVHDVESYAAAAGERAVHLFEICVALGVSRRTLHRAFADALAIGPAAYLRSRRLLAVHRALQGGGQARATIADIAFQHGFAEPGRFALYYKSMFGQSPSRTRAPFRHDGLLGTSAPVDDLAQSA